MSLDFGSLTRRGLLADNVLKPGRDRAKKGQRLQDKKGGGRIERPPKLSAMREYHTWTLSFVTGDPNDFEGFAFHGIKKDKVQDRGASPKRRAVFNQSVIEGPASCQKFRLASEIPYTKKDVQLQQDDYIQEVEWRVLPDGPFRDRLIV